MNLRMNKRVKKLWLEALEDGKYHQAYGALRMVHSGHASYCCLGVLTQLYCKEKNEDFQELAGSGTALPEEVKDWAGLEYGSPVFEADPEDAVSLSNTEDAGVIKSGDEVSLITCNDIYEFSFKEIAEVIKKYF